MAHSTFRVVEPIRAGFDAGAVRVGRVVGLEAGRPSVEFEAGGTLHRMAARVGLPALSAPPRGGWVGAHVLIVFEDGDGGRPILFGVVSDVLPAAPVIEAADGILEIDAKRLCIEGREEVVVRCGQASIVLKADGQVVVKGTRLTSRASETNKLRGATVLIN
jgi:hypothetical protein